MKRAGAVSVPGPLDAVSAAKPLDNTPHLFAVEGAKRDGPNGSHRRCDLQQMGGDGLVVRCLEDNYHVVGTDGPVGLLQLHPVLLGNLGTAVGSGDSIRYVFDALVGVVDQTDISGHRACSFPSVSTETPMVPSNAASCTCPKRRHLYLFTELPRRVLLGNPDSYTPRPYS